MTIKCQAGRSNSYERTRQILILLLLSITALAVADRAAAEPNTVEFNIPVQTVPAALNEFARQAHVQLFFITDGFENVQANPVIGTFLRQEALQRLLEGTGLEANFTPDALIKVAPATDSTSSGILPSNTVTLASADTSSDRMMAQAIDESRNAQASQGGAPAANDEKKRGAAIEEIIVTGSNIRGVEAVGVDIITLDRKYIELSGISTTTELIQSVPQNFGIGNEAVEVVGVVDIAGFNAGFSSSVNLRGLGTDSTLMLLNGRRSAAGGSSGNFVDLNTIPTAAIERIDVLPDGASAIYGSDAVGGVINVILRDDYEGAETRIRYAPGTSDIDEIQFNQAFGKKWGSGRVLFSYEYYDRSELKAKDRAYTRDSDLTSLGGSDHSITASNPGNVLDLFTFLPGFAIPAGQDGTALTPADFIDLSLNPDSVNLQNTREGTHVLPEQTRHSVFASASQELSNITELFAEARYSTREFEVLLRGSENPFLIVPESNAFFADPYAGAREFICPFIGVPTGNCTALTYNFADDFGPSRAAGDVDSFGGVLGANFTLSDSWELEVYGSYGSEDTATRVDQTPNTVLLVAALADPDPSTAFNPFADGSNTNPATLAAIAGFADVDFESELSTVNIRAEGDLSDLPGGAAKLAVGAQFREESLFSQTINFISFAEPTEDPFAPLFDRDRDITAAFAEVYLPIVSDQNSRPGIQSLAVSIAGRYEDYSDFGDTFDPKLGVAWSPVKSLKLRGTVGTSFRAPLLTELNTNLNTITARTRTDPASPSGTTNVLQLAGNDPNLTPQEGTTWTVGFDVTPESLPGFSVGLTYFDSEVDDLIQNPLPIPSTVFLDPVTNAPIIMRVDPSNDPDDLALVTALLNDPQFLDIGTPIPLPDEVGAIIDRRVQNIGKAEVSGLDLNVGYAFETSAGDFNLSVYASHLLEFREQLANGPSVDKVDTIAKPNSLQLTSSLSWNLGGVNAAVIAKHIGDYEDNLGTARCQASPCSVSSWTTWDLQLGYDFSDRSGFLEGTRFSLSVRNVFDKDPPFVEIGEDGVAFDAINADPWGQFLALQLIKTW